MEKRTKLVVLRLEKRKSVFEGTDCSNILLRLSAYAETKLVKGETLIFLDEIQECPDAVTAIKFLVEEGSYRYIMSGSLLSVKRKDIRSLAVVFLTIKEMFPLDFRLYLVVGGMPAAVAKYDPENKLYLNEIFDLIPPELNNQNKRFILKKLNENIKFSRHENSFIWLKEAGVALPVYNVGEPKIPLLLSRSRNLFKLFLNDVGLLTCQYENVAQKQLIDQLWVADTDNIFFISCPVLR